MFNIFSLRAKLTLSITLIIIGITSGLTFLSVKKEQAYYEQNLRKQGELFLDSIDVLLRNSLYSLDANSIVKSVQKFREYQDLIESVSVFDAEGRLLIESTEGLLNLKVTPDKLGRKIVKTKKPIYKTTKDHLLAAKPIIFGQGTVGGIAITLSKQSLEDKIIAVHFQGLLVAIFAVSGGVLIALFISHSLTIPLQQLMEATHHITQGNLSYRIKLKNKDEFSLLAKEFNKMTDWLETTLEKYQQNNRKLQYDLFHDSLTGLANRVYILQEIEAEINKKKAENDHNFAVLFLDCDRFKIINDSLGHDVGDQVLINIAQRLDFCIRKNDIAARLGGDEFVILIKNVNDLQQVT
ncbi:MAG: diguanylate cyclase, partial [Crocosphaera sp.]